MSGYVKILCLVLFSIFVSGQINPDGPIVKIPQGLIKGRYKKSYKNKTFSSFEGIPYAKPPTGDLRFQEPQPASIWKDTLVANKQYECLQFIPFPLFFGPRGTEDCLYLYVYVPREDINPNELLDVVIHIHGGGFMLGSPKYLAGPQFLMNHDVVFVTFNYRLNILGFLSTEDGIVPGNNGLKDQSLALEWIKENIKFFGGNPASITLTGMSAGAASVHYHYLSPLSKGLFHRGLSQSGSALHCWALHKSPLENAKTVSKNLTCPTSSSEEMVECLKNVDGNALMNATRSLYKFEDGVPFVTFGPVIEHDSNNPFISEHPYEIIKRGDVYDVPWITSNAKDEGLFPVRFVVFLKKIQELNENWFDIMPYFLDLYDTLDEYNKKNVLTQIKRHYFKNDAISEENIFTLVELFTDRLFLADTEKVVKLHASAVKSEVYYYFFSYILQMPSFLSGKLTGACHGDDARLIFQAIGTPYVLKPNDEKMMEMFTDFLVKYAKTGVATFNNKEWLPQNPDSEKLNVLSIEGVNQTEMKKIDRLGASDFWNSLPIKELEKAISSSNTIRNTAILNVIFAILFFIII